MTPNELNPQEIESLAKLEADTAAQEASWLPLQHVAATNPPVWKHAEESIDTSESIHGRRS